MFCLKIFLLISFNLVKAEEENFDNIDRKTLLPDGIFEKNPTELNSQDVEVRAGLIEGGKKNPFTIFSQNNFFFFLQILQCQMTIINLINLQ